MCGHRRSYGFWAFGLGRRGIKPDEVLRRLEEYRRDLEEELADISDLIRRLTEEKTEHAAV